MYRLLLILLFSFTAQVVFSQSLKDLQEQKRVADAEINRINEQLSATKLEKNSTLRQVALINSKIQKRKKVLENMERNVEDKQNLRVTFNREYTVGHMYRACGKELMNYYLLSL